VLFLHGKFEDLSAFKPFEWAFESTEFEYMKLWRMRRSRREEQQPEVGELERAKLLCSESLHS